MQPSDIIGGDAVWIVRIVTEHMEMASIVPVEPIFRTDPQIALEVNIQTMDHSLGKPLCHADFSHFYLDGRLVAYYLLGMEARQSSWIRGIHSVWISQVAQQRVL